MIKIATIKDLDIKITTIKDVQNIQSLQIRIYSFMFIIFLSKKRFQTQTN